MKNKFEFPPEFLFGTATSATQVEGGIENHSWYRWCQTPGKINDGSSCFRACDHWNRVEEDIALQKELGCSTYRMGLEWSRIEPSEGEWDQQAIAHYRREIELLKAAGIRPLVTLHHFTNPLWLEDRGGWIHSETPALFNRYTEVVYKALGYLVDDWITINEPNIYLLLGYQLGIWPPGFTNRTDLVLKGAKIMMEAHILAYETIHRLSKEQKRSIVRVGVAHHLRVYDGLGLLGRISAVLYERVVQNIFVESMTTGKMIFPLGKGKPMGNGPFADFIGINYYSRDMVKGRFKSFPMFGDLTLREKAPVNDLGWEIYPKGLGRLCRKIWKQYKLPIWITENGTADSRDAFRSKFLADHLTEIAELIEDGIPVQRYYHWSLMDNFEWAEGEKSRFGLVEVDYATQKRTIRASGKFFAEIAKSHKLVLSGENPR